MRIFTKCNGKTFNLKSQNLSNESKYCTLDDVKKMSMNREIVHPSCNTIYSRKKITINATSEFLMHIHYGKPKAYSITLIYCGLCSWETVALSLHVLSMSVNSSQSKTMLFINGDLHPYHWDANTTHVLTCVFPFQYFLYTLFPLFICLKIYIISQRIEAILHFLPFCLKKNRTNHSTSLIIHKDSSVPANNPRYMTNAICYGLLVVTCSWFVLYPQCVTLNEDFWVIYIANWLCYISPFNQEYYYQ